MPALSPADSRSSQLGPSERIFEVKRCASLGLWLACSSEQLKWAGLVETSSIEATIFYRHNPEEVRALETATIPMAEHIQAVGANIYLIKRILGGEYFRAGEAKSMRTMLLRAANHARMHLDDYFPMMREKIVAEAETLEEEVRLYWQLFERHNEVLPTK